MGSAEAVSHIPALIRLHLLLMDSKVYQALRNIIGGIGRTFSGGGVPSRGTLMSKIVKKADIIYNSKDYRKGIRYFSKALELSGKDSDRVKVLSKLYITYTYLNDNGNASRILQSMRQISPGIQISVPPRMYFFASYIPVQVKPFIEKANELLAKTDPQGAERVLLESLKINDSPVANRMLGEIYARNNDHQKALFHLRKIYSDFNTDPHFLHLMILVCLNNRQQQEADRCLRQLARVEPGYPELARLKEYVQGAPAQ